MARKTKCVSLVFFFLVLFSRVYESFKLRVIRKGRVERVTKNSNRFSRRSFGWSRKTIWMHKARGGKGRRRCFSCLSLSPLSLGEGRRKKTKEEEEKRLALTLSFTLKANNGDDNLLLPLFPIPQCPPPPLNETMPRCSQSGARSASRSQVRARRRGRREESGVERKGNSGGGGCKSGRERAALLLLSLSPPFSPPRSISSSS